MISAELLMVLAVLLGALLFVSSTYSELSDLVLSAFSKSREEYVRGVLSDALSGCSPSEVTVRFPYVVEIDCRAQRAYVSGRRVEIPPCAGGGEGKTFKIRGCTVTPVG